MPVGKLLSLLLVVQMLVCQELRAYLHVHECMVTTVLCRIRKQHLRVHTMPHVMQTTATKSKAAPRAQQQVAKMACQNMAMQCLNGSWVQAMHQLTV